MHHIFDTDTRKWVFIPNEGHTTYIGSMKEQMIEVIVGPLKDIREVTSKEKHELMLNYTK